MNGPDPFSTMTYAQMLRTQADERERVRRRRPQRPRYDDATEPITVPPWAMLNTLLGAMRAALGRPVAMLRGYVRPRAAL